MLLFKRRWLQTQDQAMVEDFQVKFHSNGNSAILSFQDSWVTNIQSHLLGNFFQRELLNSPNQQERYKPQTTLRLRILLIWTKGIINK